MKTLLKIGIGFASFGIIGMILISVISLLAYGKIYMYNGYAFTGVLWTICFVSVGIGAFLLVLSLSVFLKDKKPKIAVALLLALILVVIIASFKACGILGEEINRGNDKTCGVCGGDGVFNDKVCKNCGGWGEEK